jgi:hypothetical protein
VSENLGCTVYGDKPATAPTTADRGSVGGAVVAALFPLTIDNRYVLEVASAVIGVLGS